MIKIKKINLNNIIDAFLVIYVLFISIFVNAETFLITNITALFLIFLLVIYAINKKILYIGIFEKVFIYFLLFCFVSISWAQSHDSAITSCITITILCFLSILVYNYLRREQKIIFFIRLLALNGVLYALIVIFFYGISGYFSDLASGIRMGDEITNVNAIGISTAISAIINFWYFLYKKEKMYFFFTALCVIVALGTGSRKALFALIMGLFTLYALKQERGQQFKIILQGVIIFSLFFFVLQLPYFETINARFETMLAGFTGHASVDSSTTIRLTMIHIGWQEFLERPFWGVGIGNSWVITQKWLGWETYLHNNYIELLASIGFIGTLIYYMFFIVPLRRCLQTWKNRNDEVILTVILLVIYLIIQWGVVIYYSKMEYLYIVFFFLSTDNLHAKKESVHA